MWGFLFYFYYYTIPRLWMTGIGQKNGWVVIVGSCGREVLDKKFKLKAKHFQFVFVYVCVCARASMRACMRPYVCKFLRACLCLY